MPSYKGHLLVGLALFLVVLLAPTTIEDKIALFLITVIYSLLPDIDVSTSKIGKPFRLVLLAFVIIAIFLSLYWLALLFAFLLCLFLLVRHRGFFHTIRAAIFLSLPFLLFNWFYFLYACGMYVIHLILDGSTKL